jgi:hypothetical protein
MCSRSLQIDLAITHLIALTSVSTANIIKVITSPTEDFVVIVNADAAKDMNIFYSEEF